MFDDYKFLSKLSQNLLEILNDEEYYDITIEVGNDPYIKIFRAHMVILYYRSSYLRRILSTCKKKNDGTLVHVKLPNISPEIFHIILRYIYGGKLALKEYDTLDIIKILEAASQINLQELIDYLQSFLIKNKANWMEQNFSLIHQTSFKHDSFLELQKFCNDLISNKPEKIFNSPDFVSIPEKSLVSLIQNDNLQASEVQVWEHVLKWGIAQNPELPSDPTSFSKDDFNSLKNSLRQCITFIRFYNLTSEEFSDKVLPYRKIIPKELYIDLIKYFLNPNSMPTKKQTPRKTERIKEINSKNIDFDSKIITLQHAELISKWINKLEITDELYKLYGFKLLFRGSRDGLKREKFHELCDGKSHTVTIVKVAGSDKILGGYNTIAWKSSGGYSYAKDNFIFSFKNRNSDSIKNYILSRVINENKAVFNGSCIGPSFGTDFCIWDSRSYRDCYCLRNVYVYENWLNISVEECEIFQIV